MARTKQQARGEPCNVQFLLLQEEDKIVKTMRSPNGEPPSIGTNIRCWDRITHVIEDNRNAYGLATKVLKSNDHLNDNRSSCKHLNVASIGTGECKICSSLICAVKLFDLTEVTRSLTTLQADPMCVDVTGKHVLYLLLCQPACKPSRGEGDFETEDPRKVEVAKLLLRFGADIACTDPFKYPLFSFDLCGCIERGETLFVSFMISSGYKFLYLSNAPILVACSHRNLRILRKLLESGANPNESRRCFDCRCALQISVEQMWVEGVDTLIEGHAFLDQKDEARNTALDYASRLPLAAGNLIIIKKLLQAGATVTRDLLLLMLRTGPANLDFLDYVLLCKNGHKLINRSFFGLIGDDAHYPVTFAWMGNDIEKFKLLLKHGAEYRFALGLHSDYQRLEHASHLQNLQTFLKEFHDGQILEFKTFVEKAVSFNFPIAQLFLRESPLTIGPPADTKGLLRFFFIQACETVEVSSRTYRYLHGVAPSAAEDIILSSVSGLGKLKFSVQKIRQFFNYAADVRSLVQSFLVEKNK